MDEANIHSSHHFIKQIEYRMKKLSETLEQLDILIYSAGQACRELRQICRDEQMKK
jgi:hypothetical protein